MLVDAKPPTVEGADKLTQGDSSTMYLAFHCR